MEQILQRLNAAFTEKSHGAFKEKYTVNRHLRLIAITAMFVVASFAPNVQAKDREYLVKAAFLYRIAKFVEWPAESFVDTHAPFTIGILGEKPLDVALNAISDKNVKGREVVIKRSARIEDLQGCHIIFICASKRKYPAQIFDNLKGLHVLTVGEVKNFAQVGGIINFVTVGNKIRMEINVDAARKAGLKISSMLLGVSRIVRDDSREGG